MGKRFLALTCVLVGIGLVPSSAAAATLTVDTTDDGPAVAADCTTPVPGSCSIRDALTAATNNADPEDEVVVPAGTYVLTEGALFVSGDQVDMSGAGARQTIIDAAGTDRVLNVQANDSVISDLTLRNGLADFDLGSSDEFTGDGGAIIATGDSLTLQRVTVSGSAAELNGGGIAAPPESTPASDLTIVDSTISGNRVVDVAEPDPALESIGGGVQAFGDLIMTNSTISSNTIETPGTTFGGGLALGVDADIDDPADLPTATITNSTITGNAISVAPGGIGSGLGIFNPTALPLTGELEIRNTIVAGNLGATPATTNCGPLGMPTSVNNLSGDGSCMFADEGSVQNADPQLGELEDNGGPTDTHALSAASPAVNAGTNEGCPAADQRVIARPQETTCDIGAFEREADPTPPPPPAEPRADLALGMKVKPKRPKVGKKVTYTVRVRNLGPDAAPGTTVKGKLPIITRKIKGQRACAVTGNKPGKRKFTCRLGDLASGDSRKLKLVARPDSRIRRPRATARVVSDVADPNKGNNRAKAVVKARR